MAENGAGRELVGRTVQVAPELVEVASEALAFDIVQVEEVERRLSAVAASMDFRVRKVDILGLMSSVSIFEVGDPTGIDGCDVDSERSDLCGGVLWPGARTAAHALASRGPLAGKHVVELGAGTGLVSMTAAMLGAADVLRHVERAIFCGVTAAGFLRLSPGAQGFGPGLLAIAIHTVEATPPLRRNVRSSFIVLTTQVLATDSSAAALELIEAAAEAQGLRQLRSGAPRAHSLGVGGARPCPDTYPYANPPPL